MEVMHIHLCSMYKLIYLKYPKDNYLLHSNRNQSKVGIETEHLFTVN